MSRRQPKTVVLDRPGADGPTFNEVLRGHAEDITLCNDSRDRIACQSMLWVGPLDAAKEDVGVG